MNKIKSLGLFLLIAGLISTGCSSSQQVSSLSNDGKIIIDGRQSDWDQMTSIEGENIAFGFRNDSENLYLGMITNDRNKIMKIIRGGLTVWLAPENSDDIIGIRYPDKQDPSEIQFQSNQQQPEMKNQDQQKPGMKMQENIDLAVYSALTKQKDIYILNDEEKVIKSLPIDGEAYEAKISFDKGNLCYEIKIPIGELLTVSSGLRTSAGSKVNVEFLSGEIETDNRMKRPDMEGEGMPPSGPPPGGGDFPGRPGGPPGERPDGNSGNRNDTTPIDYSFDVLLYK